VPEGVEDSPNIICRGNVCQSYIGQIAAIVGIRTVLNFFLTRELKQMGNIKSNVQN
jgi:hypothetical protein